jgi:hypothetical protein
MFQQEELILQEYLQGQHLLKFVRRPDLSPELRLYIACLALNFSGYGTITNLSQRYNISRSFIYHLRKQLLMYGWAIFGMQPKSEQNDSDEGPDKELLLLQEILSLRLEGRCSIIGISLLLKRRGMQNTSIGYISQVLNEVGKSLDPVIGIDKALTFAVVFASDEVFAGQRPILITVDPVSSAILRMEIGQDRKQESWTAHWNSLLDAGVVPLLLTNDEGSGMKAAGNEVLAQIPRQTDTFHGIAHRLGDICRILEQQAYGAIGEEYERERVILSARQPAVIEKRQQAYQQAIARSAARIQLYDGFYLYYRYMIEQFQIFDEQGQVRCAKTSRENLQEAISAMKSLGHEKTNKQLKTIEGLIDELFVFLQQAQKVVRKLNWSFHTPVLQQALHALCRAYQYQKNTEKAKNAAAKKYNKRKQEEGLLEVQILLEHTSVDFEVFKKQCYTQLDTIVQSSALVETINSIIRMYLNGAKNQVNQAQLNLIMFYHNHRRYVQGKRKGYTPMELLTGNRQHEDWLDLLIEKVSKAA